MPEHYNCMIYDWRSDALPYLAFVYKAANMPPAMKNLTIWRCTFPSLTKAYVHWSIGHDGDQYWERTHKGKFSSQNCHLPQGLSVSKQMDLQSMSSLQKPEKQVDSYQHISAWTKARNIGQLSLMYNSQNMENIMFLIGFSHYGKEYGCACLILYSKKTGQSHHGDAWLWMR